MIWVPVAAIGFVLLIGPTILAIGAWVRAQDAQERLKLYERRIAELEARAGIARPRAAAVAKVAGAAVARAEDGAAIEERIALVWFSRIGVAVMLLGALWFFLSPGDTAGGRAARAAACCASGDSHSRPCANHLISTCSFLRLSWASVGSSSSLSRARKAVGWLSMRIVQ
jgi:hypothetical protein